MSIENVENVVNPPSNPITTHNLTVSLIIPLSNKAIKKPIKNEPIKFTDNVLIGKNE